MPSAFWPKKLSNDVSIKEWRLDLLAVFYIAIGGFVGAVLVISGALQLFADATSSITLSSDTDFGLGTLATTEVVGSGVDSKIQLTGGEVNWADGNWSYRRPITINNPYSSALSEYQVKVTLTTSNFDYTNVDANCGDVRFATDSAIFLDYYQLSCDTSGTSEFWVQVDTLNVGDNDLYIYYGNASATSESSEVDTFSYTDEQVVAYMLEPYISNLQVISLEDGNSVSHNGSTLNLDEMGTGSFSSLNTYAPISAKKLFEAKNSSASDMMVPVSWAGTDFAIRNRSSGYQVHFAMVSPWGTAQVQLFTDGSQCGSTRTVTDTGLLVTDCSVSSYGHVRISSDIPILVAKVHSSGNDPYPVPPTSTDSWYGWDSSQVNVAAIEQGADYRWIDSNDSSETNPTDLGANGGVTISASGGSLYSGATVRVRSVDYPILPVSNADGDGGDATTFVTSEYFGTKFGSPFSTDFVSVVSDQEATCTTYNSGGTPLNTVTLESTNGDVYALPASAFGIGNSSTYISGAWKVECDLPVYVVSQYVDDEQNNFSYPMMRQYVYPTPVVADPGAEQGSLSPSGTWESAGDNNAIQVDWNGGWGDGTDPSTAFSATVENVGSNASIAFEIRVADSVANLGSASYSLVGVANSGSTFTVTKADLDLLGISTGTAGKYIQLKATLTSADGITNPALDGITIYYLSDDTSPEANASNITMYRTATGAEVSEGEWANSEAPMFSWDAGVDSQAGILGYCLYLGQTIDGDPELAKGILGDSPVDTTGTTCQFIIDTPTIDFANTSYQGATWLTSDNDLYYMNIKAIDNARNIYSADYAQFSFYFDSTPPTNPSYMSLPGDFISTKDVSITWPIAGGDASNDIHSGLAGLQYRIGADGTWYGDSHTGSEDLTDLLNNDGMYRTDETYDYPALEEGSNFIYLRSWDLAGNVTFGYASGVIKINTIAPSPVQNLFVTPTDNTLNEYAFEWDASSTFTGLESNLTYCYTVNTLPSELTCNFTGAGVTSLSTDAYANQPGVNTLYVVARDEAQNINYDAYTGVQFTYAGSAPGIPINLDVADISVKATSNWRLAMSWEEPTNAGAGVATYRVYRSTEPVTCTDNFAAFGHVGTVTNTTFVDIGLEQESYQYCIRACDSANNCSAPSSTSTGYPDGKFTEPAELISGPDISNLTTRSVSISWITARTSDSRVAYGLETDNHFEEEPSTSKQVTAHEINLTALQPGTNYYYRAKWVDEDGNMGISDEQLFTTLPAPTVKDVSIVRTGLDYAIINFTTYNATAAKVYFGQNTGFGGLKDITTSPVESSYTMALDGLQDGTKYFYKINPVDMEGYEYEGTVLEFATMPRPKISQVQIQEKAGAAQPTMMVSWLSNTGISSVVSYYPADNPGASRDEVNIELINGEHEMEITGLLPNTNYMLVVKGRDMLGNQAVSDSYQFTTATDSRPPLVSNLRVEGTIVTGGEAERGKNAQLIVAWDTDEPSTSQVEYGQGAVDVYTQKTAQDMNLTYNHLVILSGLTPSQVYHLRVVSADEAGNLGYSGDSIQITPKDSGSAFELVMQSVGDIFGFLSI